MKPADGCHGCYDTNVTVQCGGLLLRKRDGSDSLDDDSNLEHQVTAENCIQSGGRCCDSPLIPQLICAYLIRSSWHWMKTKNRFLTTLNFLTYIYVDQLLALVSVSSTRYNIRKRSPVPTVIPAR